MTETDSIFRRVLRDATNIKPAYQSDLLNFCFACYHTSCIWLYEYAQMTNIISIQVAKTSKVEKFRSAAKGLVAAIRVNADYVAKRRQQLECGPADAAALADFLTSSSEKEKVV